MKVLSRGLVVFFAVSLSFCLVACSGKGSESSSEVVFDETLPQIEYIDTDEYYRENAQIISEIRVEDAQNITTEEETYDMMENRGFGQIQITSMYNMNGEFLSDDAIDDKSSEKHPLYTTLYFSQSGEIWVISVVNGSVSASPVNYNENHSFETLIVEEDTIMAYDGKLNKFYEIVPSDSLAITKRVERIDAETLENLTAEEIDKL